MFDKWTAAFQTLQVKIYDVSEYKRGEGRPGRRVAKKTVKDFPTYITLALWRDRMLGQCHEYPPVSRSRFHSMTRRQPSECIAQAPMQRTSDSAIATTRMERMLQ